MFELLRRMIFPIIIIVLVFFTGMIVLEWGLGFSGSGQFARATAAGVVNGEEITWQQWQSNYSNLYQSEADQANGEVTEARQKELEQIAFDQLVADRILFQEADKRNLVITDDDVYMYLKVSPPRAFQMAQEFQTNGQFDYQKYLAAMADPAYATVWNAIEPDIRRELTKIRVQQLVTSAPHVTESEIRQTFLNARESVKIGTINAQTTSFYSQIEPASDEDTRAYFGQHRDKYTVGERVNLRVVSVDHNPSAADSAYAERLARSLYDSVTSGSDFAELAQIYSDDPGSAQNGGDLGLFEQGRMVAPFDSAVFAMKDGDISTPVATRFGWHIIQHHGFEQEDGKKKARASHILIKPEATPETLQERLTKMEQYVERARSVGFVEAALEYGLTVDTVTNLLSGQRIPSLGAMPTPEITDWAFAAKNGDISEVFRTRDHYAVVIKDDELAEGPAEFEQVEDQIKRDIRQERAEEMAKEVVDKAWGAVQSGMSFEKAAGEVSVKYTEVGPFTRVGNVQALNSDPKAIGAAFALKEVGQMSPPIEYTNGYIIMKLLERTEPDQTQFVDARDSVRTALLGEKQQNAYIAWYESRLEDAEVQNNLNWQNEAQ